MILFSRIFYFLLVYTSYAIWLGSFLLTFIIMLSILSYFKVYKWTEYVRSSSLLSPICKSVRQKDLAKPYTMVRKIKFLSGYNVCNNFVLFFGPYELKWLPPIFRNLILLTWRFCCQDLFKRLQDWKGKFSVLFGLLNIHC